jgi:selenide,water dikinase
VHLVAPGVAIIGTLDFFPPIVDDPRTVRRDRGGECASPTCSRWAGASSSRCPWPRSRRTCRPAHSGRSSTGAAGVVREAGGILAGGHTIRDPEPKYGLAAIGVAAPDRLLRKGGAQPGDVLVLTKPLGTGLLVSGRRRGLTSDADLAAAIDSMRALNRRAAEVLVEHEIRGATDVTGFGLLGHGLEMARASGTSFVFDADGSARARWGPRARPGGRRDRRRRAQPPLRRAGPQPWKRRLGRAGHPRPRSPDLGRPARGRGGRPRTDAPPRPGMPRA